LKKAKGKRPRAKGNERRQKALLQKALIENEELSHARHSPFAFIIFNLEQSDVVCEARKRNAIADG
jgi:multidrug resistance efflux pump